MKKWISTMMIMILATSFLAGCGSTKEAVPPKAEEKTITIGELFPLEKDSYWKYEVEDQSGSFIEQRVVYQEGNKAQVAVIDSSTEMAIVYEYQGEGQTLAAVNSREEHYDEKSLLAEASRFNNVILQGPIAVDSTWVSDGLTYTITDLGATVTIGKENFTDCVVVEAKDSEGTFSNTAYYKAGVGLVKEVAQGEEFRKVKNLVGYH